MTTCSVDGCDGEVVVRKRMLCRSHYNKFLGESRRNRKETCSLDDCDGYLYAKGYCRKHHAKWAKYGVPYRPHVEKAVELCIEPDCDDPVRSRSRCPRHYAAWYRENLHGSPTRPLNKKDEVGYLGIHERVRRVRGKASDYQCVDCPNQARDWSLRYDAPVTLIQQGGGNDGTKYSLDINDYEPRCFDCHKAYDVRYKNGKAYKGAT